MNKTIAILGATGTTGKAVVLEALRQGYNVRALARTPSKLDIQDPKLEIIAGNGHDLSVIVELLTGCYGAISTLGPGFDMEVAKTMVSTCATKNVIQAMGQLKIKRYIVMSGASVVLPGDRPTSIANLITRFVFPSRLGDILKDKYLEYELLKNSDLDWTIARCPGIRETDKKSLLQIQRKKHNTLWVDKLDLAKWMVAQVESDEFIKKAIFASSKD